MAAILIILGGLVLGWMGVSAMTERGVKEPAYRLEKQADGYELRRYPPYLVAEVAFPAGETDPLGKGFRLLFDYIAGANLGRRKLEMTAPVLEERGGGVKIPMTKPVLQERAGEGSRVAFVLPEGLSLESAPQPEDSRVRLRQVPARRMAVLRFSGYADEGKFADRRRQLLDRLARDGLQPAGAMLRAYYNPPWTPPFMRRNEVLVEIE